MKRTVLGIVFVGVAGLLALGIIGVVAWRALTVPLDRTAEAPVLVRVDKGDSVAAVAAQLEEKQLIRSAFWFRLVARVNGSTLDTGLYHLVASQTALQMLAPRPAGDIAEIQVTLPEGWRSEEIFDRLNLDEIVSDWTSFTSVDAVNT